MVPACITRNFATRNGKSKETHIQILDNNKHCIALTSILIDTPTSEVESLARSKKSAKDTIFPAVLNFGFLSKPELAP